MLPAEATSGAPRILALGDDALLVELGTPADGPDGVGAVVEARRARRLAAAVRALGAMSPNLAIGEPVAAASSVLVPFDPLAAGGLDGGLDGGLAVAALAARLADLAASIPAAPPADEGSRRIEVPVRFGGGDGPDLAAVAAETGLTEPQVLDLLAATDLEVLFLGFAPGFAYMGDLPPALVVPRLAVPRTRVPGGSVAIAGRCAGIYPQASAGGWRILGRTSVQLFDPRAAEPALLRAGDRVRLVPT